MCFFMSVSHTSWYKISSSLPVIFFEDMLTTVLPFASSCEYSLNISSTFHVDDSLYLSFLSEILPLSELNVLQFRMMEL